MSFLRLFVNWALVRNRTPTCLDFSL